MDIKTNDKIYIFGAHPRAQTLSVYLQYLYPSLQIQAFLYDNDEMNPKWIHEVPVLQLDSARNLDLQIPVFIGTRGIYHKALIEKLQRMGFTDIYPVTVEMDRKLRNAFLETYLPKMGREFCKIDELKYRSVRCGRNEEVPKVTVYVAKSVFDKPLQESYQLDSYEREIQVGAALTERRLSEEILTDCTGKHISERNKQFCELTALYWVWQNAKEDVVGLVHYRRHFLLPEDWLQRIEQHEIDVILPVPLYVAPDLEQNYKGRHDAAVWDVMMQYLEKNRETEYQNAKRFFAGNLYSPCNMFIMRREILHELCEWMFPILFAAVEQNGEKADVYQNRYPGFLSERLMSFFFDMNWEKYRIVYADKNFLF